MEAVVEEKLKTASSKAASKKKAKEVPEQDPLEMVIVRLHMDKQHMEPLHVQVNDYITDIPRGQDFPVPYYVAKHIEEMEAQDNRTLLLTRALKERFDKKAQALGIG